jgi:Siphovirus Gp157
MTASTLKLYEATDAIEIVRDWILEHDEEMRANEGVLPDELAELLAQVEGDFAQKAERVALFVRELLATAKAIKLEEERLSARRKSMENAADRLKRYLETNMLLAEKMRIEGKLVTLRIQKNPPSCSSSVGPADLEAYSHVPELAQFIEIVPATYRLNASTCRPA